MLIIIVDIIWRTKMPRVKYIFFWPYLYKYGDLVSWRYEYTVSNRPKYTIGKATKNTLKNWNIHVS